MGARRCFGRIFVLMVISAVAMLIGATTALAAETFKTTQITSNSDDDLGPQISGDRIVWSSPGGTDGGADYEVFTWTPEGGIVQITTNTDDDRNPCVSGDRVVWQGKGGNGASTGTDWEIFYWTPSGVVLLTDNAVDDEAPRVSGDRIVWQGKGGSDGGTDYEIFTYKAFTTTQLGANAYDDERPRVSGDRIVWQAKADGSADTNYEIFTWASSTVTRLTTDSVIDKFPEVSGDRVVWQSYVGTPVSWDIYTWTSGGGAAAPVRSTTNAHEQYPVISGDLVAWQGERGTDNGTDYEIFAWTPSTDGLTQVTTNSYDDAYPRVSDGRAVWWGQDGSDYEVFTWSSSGGTTQLTDDSYQSTLPAYVLDVSGENVVWYAPGGSEDPSTDTEIFLAAHGDAPFVDSLDPDSGRLTGGNPVTINGQHLGSATDVTFDGASASILGGGDTQLTVLAPAHAAGDVVVQVSTIYGESDEPSNSAYEYVSPPLVTSVSPNTGPSLGGGTITLTGERFEDVEEVLFGGAPATSIHVIDDQNMTASLPEWWWGGTVNVRVISTYGVSEDNGTADDFTFSPAASRGHFDITKVTDDGAGKGVYVGIDGDRIVWTAMGGTDGGIDHEVFTMELGDSSPTQITQNGIDERSVQVSGDRIVWVADDGSGLDIYTWTPETDMGASVAATTIVGGTEQITDDSVQDDCPQVSGDRIVWQRGETMSLEIYTWTPDEPAHAISDNSTPDTDPQIDGDRVVWVYQQPSGVTQICTWEVGDGTSVTQLTDGTVNNSSPQVSGDRVVWQADNADQTDTDIYTCEVGSPEALISDDSGWDYTPLVSGARVVWQSWNEYGSRIYTWTPTGGVVTLANYNLLVEIVTDISGDRVVWFGSTAPDSSMMSISSASATLTATGETPSLSAIASVAALGSSHFEVATWTPDGGHVRLTDNLIADMWPQVSGDNIVWLGGAASAGVFSQASLAANGVISPGAAEIYVATPSAPVVVGQPTVSAVDPSSGPTAGGASVTLTGTNFVDVTAVTFGGIAAKSFSVTSDTKITAVTPAHAAGLVTVQVLATGGMSAQTNNYTYVEPPITRYQQSDGRIYYSGTWYTANYWKHSGGNLRFTYSRGSSAYIPFWGTRLDWIAKTGWGMGIAAVEVDGGATQLVNLYSAVTEYNVKVWSTGDLPDGLHWVKISCSGIPSWGGGRGVSVDALDVAGKLAWATRYQESDSRLEYSEAYLGWRSFWGYSYSGLRQVYANAPGNSVTIRFDGIALNVIGTKARSYGKAWVSVDGGPRHFIDFYSYTARYKQVVWSSGYLKPGEHVVTISWSPWRDVRSRGFAIDLDALDIVGELK